MTGLKNIYKNFMHFAEKNPLYLICTVIYFRVTSWLIGWSWRFLIFFLITYALSQAVAFSILGEKLLRLLNHIRRLESSKEKEYLRPLFQEVYNKAKDNNPELEKIDIYITDSAVVNASAVGKHTVAVTKGAIHTLSEEQLKAMMAHEIAHIVNTDTAAMIYAMVGNGIFSAIVLAFKLICWIIGFIWNGNRKRNFIEVIADWIVSVFLFLMTILMALSDRKAELRADEYTVTLGYGEDMVEALYLLEKISLGKDRSITEKLLARHPRVTRRIENLEVRLGVQEGE